MPQLKARGHPDAPPAMAADGHGSYREAMVETWGQVPEYSGRDGNRRISKLTPTGTTSRWSRVDLEAT